MNFATVNPPSIKRAVMAFLVLAGVLAGPPPATVAQSDPPLDLAALILHSDDLDWLIDEPGHPINDAYPYGMSFSTSFTTIDEAVRNSTYAEGRGGLTLGLMGEREATAMLEDAGWIRSHSALLDLPEPGRDGYWSLGVAITIEEFENEDGAEEALAWFDDTDLLEELTISESATPIEPALEIDGATTRGWELVTHQYADGVDDHFTTLWAQVDNLVVSVALMNTYTYPAPDIDLLIPLVEQQLKRLELAEYLYQPGLSVCAPEFQDERTTDIRAEYQTLNGKTFALSAETFEDLDIAQAEIDEQGMVDSYVATQRIDDTAVGALDGEVWYRGQVRNLTSDDAAADYLAGVEEAYLRDNPSYSDVEQIDDHPDLGDGTALFNHTASDGHATIILVQVDDQVFSIRLDAMTDYQPDIVIELAEAQLERMENGDCDPLELPDALFDRAMPTTAAIPATLHA